MKECEIYQSQRGSIILKPTEKPKMTKTKGVGPMARTKCLCGQTIAWRKYMKHGIKQICPKCGAWWLWESTGLHISKRIKMDDGKVTYHIFVPILSEKEDEISGNRQNHRI